MGEWKAAARAHLADAGVDKLPDDWGVVELGDILSEDRGVSVGVMYPGDHVPDGVPLIKAGDLNGSIINTHPAFRISRGKHHEYRRTELEGGELLMTLVGNVGQCAVAPPHMSGWNTARAVAVMRLADPSDAHFVQQCLLSRPLRHLMDVWCNTTVQATLNLKEIRHLPIPWPPKTCRDAIAAFRHAGRQDRAEPADERDAGGDGAGALQVVVRGLRPRPRQSRRSRPRPTQAHRRPLPRFLRGLGAGGDSEGVGGKVHRRPCERCGWRHAEHARNRATGTAGHITGPRRKIYRDYRFRSCSIPSGASPTQALRRSVPACCPKGTVLLSSRAPIGYLVVTEIPVAINQGFIAMNAKNGVSNLFLLLWASVAHEEIVSRANGSTFLEISKTNFRPIPVVTPSDVVMQKFDATGAASLRTRCRVRT